MKKALITGANGFVGQDLTTKLIEAGYIVVCVTRSPFKRENTTNLILNSIDDQTDWTNALDGIDCVFHLAARVHVMDDRSDNPIESFRKINVLGTRNLAEAALRARVKHFVYLSSIKVNGEETKPGKPFQIDDPANPLDPYGQSKWEAEQALADLLEKSDMALSIVRPPLVYGPGVKANFQSLLKLAEKNYPVPLGALHHKRAQIYLENLTDFLVHLDKMPLTGVNRSLISDPESLSITDLYNQLVHLMGQKPRNIPIPSSLLKLIGTITGKTAQIQRLCEPLEIDCRQTLDLTGWQAPFEKVDALKNTVNWYKTVMKIHPKS